MEKNDNRTNGKIHSRFGIIGISPKMQIIFDIIEKASKTTATVLISGSSGTGYF